MRKKVLFVLLFFLFSPHLRATKIERAYEALKIYDYFKAKRCFEQTLKRHVSASSYGLATIYYRSDNPFHNIDSAFRYILISDSTYKQLDEKRKAYYVKIAREFDYVNLYLLKTKISTEFFKLAAKENSIDSYDKFLKDHPWSNEYFTALHLRDSIAFAHALSFNTSTSLGVFMKNYPYSEYFNRAKIKFDDLLFKEFTKSRSLNSYLEFLSKYPGSSHERDAEDQVYRILTETNTIESYHSFLKSYPHNRNVGLAWRKIYQLFMSEFNDNRIDEFRVSYPDYPYVEELELDIKNFKLQLLPFNQGELFGFMDYEGVIRIEPQFEQAGFFVEGLATVMKDQKYGFIDKGNKLIVPFVYTSVTDFENGRSIVEIDGKFGMIDRSGKLILPIVFDDIGGLSNGLAYGKKDSLYAYYDVNGQLRIPEKFEEAFSFSDSIAKVQIGSNQAFIDVFGNDIVSPTYQKIEFFSDTLLIFMNDNKYGLMKRNCEIVVNPQYDRILKPVIDRTMVIQNGKIGYIDLSGNTLIPAQYEMFPNSEAKGQFNSNLTVIKFKGKYGVIDKNGCVILAAVFSEIGDMSSLIAFSKGKGWGYIDLLGKVVVQPVYSYAESFVSGTAIVEKNGFQGVIDSKGMVLLPLEYKNISRIGKEYFVVYNGLHYGLFNTKAEPKLVMEYGSVRQVDKDLFVMSRDGQLQYFLAKESRVIKPNRVVKSN